MNKRNHCRHGIPLGAFECPTCDPEPTAVERKLARELADDWADGLPKPVGPRSCLEVYKCDAEDDVARLLARCRTHLEVEREQARQQSERAADGSARDGAPLDVAVLPDWWDARRADAGKGHSTCAAELRLALEALRRGQAELCADRDGLEAERDHYRERARQSALPTSCSFCGGGVVVRCADHDCRAPEATPQKR